MNRREMALESARAVFMAHREKCVSCQKYDFSTKTIQNMCWTGVQNYKDVLRAEDDIVGYENSKAARRAAK